MGILWGWQIKVEMSNRFSDIMMSLGRSRLKRNTLRGRRGGRVLSEGGAERVEDESLRKTHSLTVFPHRFAEGLLWASKGLGAVENTDISQMKMYS